MLSYTVKYSTGTSRHDEVRRVTTISAKNFSEAGEVAEKLATRRGGVVTSITRKTPAFKQ